MRASLAAAVLLLACAWLSDAQTLGWHRYSLSSPAAVPAALSAMGIQEANFTELKPDEPRVFRFPFSLFDVPSEFVSVDTAGSLHFGADRCCPATPPSSTTSTSEASSFPAPASCARPCLSSFDPVTQPVLPGELDAVLTPFALKGYTPNTSDSAFRRHFYLDSSRGLFVVRSRFSFMATPSKANDIKNAVYELTTVLQAPDTSWTLLRLPTYSPSTPFSNTVKSAVLSLAATPSVTCATTPSPSVGSAPLELSKWPAPSGSGSSGWGIWPGFRNRAFAATMMDSKVSSTLLLNGETYVVASIPFAGTACLSPIPARPNDAVLLSVPSFGAVLRGSAEDAARGPAGLALIPPAGTVNEPSLECIISSKTNVAAAERTAVFLPGPTHGPNNATEMGGLGYYASSGSVYRCSTHEADTNVPVTLRIVVPPSSWEAAASAETLPPRVYDRLRVSFAHDPLKGPGMATLSVSQRASSLEPEPTRAVTCACEDTRTQGMGFLITAAKMGGTEEGEASGDANGWPECRRDCDGVLHGPKITDPCGLCILPPSGVSPGGLSSSAMDCHGQCFGAGSSGPLGPCPDPSNPALSDDITTISSALNVMMPFKIISVLLMCLVLGLAAATAITVHLRRRSDRRALAAASTAGARGTTTDSLPPPSSPSSPSSAAAAVGAGAGVGVGASSSGSSSDSSDSDLDFDADDGWARPPRRRCWCLAYLIPIQSAIDPRGPVAVSRPIVVAVGGRGRPRAATAAAAAAAAAGAGAAGGNPSLRPQQQQMRQRRNAPVGGDVAL